MNKKLHLTRHNIGLITYFISQGPIKFLTEWKKAADQMNKNVFHKTKIKEAVREKEWIENLKITCKRGNMSIKGNCMSI